MVLVPVIILRDEMSFTHSHALNLLHLTSALLQKERERGKKGEEDRKRDRAQQSHQRRKKWEGARKHSSGNRERVNKKLFNKNETVRRM